MKRRGRREGKGGLPLSEILNTPLPLTIFQDGGHRVRIILPASVLVSLVTALV